MTTLAYPAAVARDGKSYMVTFPDFGTGATHGETREEALGFAADLLETIVSAYVANGRALPKPSPARGRPLVHLAPLEAAKALLYLEFRRAGISKAALARRLGWAMPQVMRVFDLRHRSGIEQIEAAMRALGKSLVVASRDAA